MRIGAGLTKRAVRRPLAVTSETWLPGATGVWEVDEFLDRELILAEIELEAEDQPVEIPPEIAAVMDREVTDEPAFSNYKLSR